MEGIFSHQEKAAPSSAADANKLFHDILNARQKQWLNSSQNTACFEAILRLKVSDLE